MSTASLQKLFDKALKKVSKQGFRSVDHPATGACLYRAGNGARCAIGHLLTNKQMQKHGITESKAPGYFSKALCAELAPFTKYEDVQEFLYALRNAHDNAPDEDFQNSYRLAMEGVAKAWNLKMP